MNNLHAKAPVDKMTAIVTYAKGVNFEPNKKVLNRDNEFPIKIRKIGKKPSKNKDFKNLTGIKFGLFTVIGIAEEYKGAWVVRCNCGRYSTRTKKAILNEKNNQDRCEHCRHLVFLKRNDFHRATGIYKDVFV
jgi:hypothetical protein